MCVQPIGRKAVSKSCNLSKPMKQYKAICNDFGLIECISFVHSTKLKLGSRIEQNKGEIMDLANVVFDTANVLAVGSLVLVGTGVIWGIKKTIGIAK